MQKTVKIKMESILKNFKITNKELENKINIFSLNCDSNADSVLDRIIDDLLYANIMNIKYNDYSEEDFNKEIEKLVKI